MIEAGDDSIIAEGGAAATAYARLQFEQMDAQTQGSDQVCPAPLLRARHAGDGDDCRSVAGRLPGVIGVVCNM